MADNPLQTCHAIAERAIQYAREISFPRQVGTEGEERAQTYLLEKIAAWGWQVRPEAFAYRPGFDTLVKGEIGAVLLADTVLAWAPLATLPGLGPVVAGLVLVALLSSSRLLRKALEWMAGMAGSNRSPGVSPLGSRAKRSLNIVAELERSPDPGRTPPPRSEADPPRIPDRSPGQASEVPGPPDPGPRPLPGESHLVLLAHYDSKSQTLPLLVRMMAFLVFGISSLILALGHLPALAFLVEHGSSAYLSALSSGLLLLINQTGNRSPGGLDNAASVGLLLALAEALAAQRAEEGDREGRASRLRLTLVFTGAEEAGLAGAYAFLVRHQPRLEAEKERLYLLNLDGVGAAGPLVIFSQPGRRSRRTGRDNPMLSLVERAAQAEKIPRWRLTSLWSGMLADHLPFAQRGYAAITLSSYAAATWTIHTDRDTPEGIDPEGMAKAAALLGRVIDFIAQASQGSS